MFRLASFTTRQLNGVGIRLPAVVASGLGLTTFTATDGVYYGSWYDNSYLNFGFLSGNSSYSTIQSALERMMPGDTFVVSDGIRKQTLTLGYDIANPSSFGSFSSTDYGGFIDWAASVIESNLNYNAGSGLFASTITSIAIPVDTSGTSILKIYNGNINTATAGTVISLSISPSMTSGQTPTEVLTIMVAGIGDENTDVYNMYSGTIEIRTSAANYWTTLHVTGQEPAYKSSNPPYTTTYRITVQETLTSYNQYGTIVIYGIRYTPGANGTNPNSGGGGSGTAFAESSTTFAGASSGLMPWERSSGWGPQMGQYYIRITLASNPSAEFVDALNALTAGSQIQITDAMLGTQTVELMGSIGPYAGFANENYFVNVTSNPFGSDYSYWTSITLPTVSSGTTYTAGTDYSGSMPGGMIIFSNPSGYGANIDSANWTNQTGFAAVLALTSGSSFTAMINGTSTTVTLGGAWTMTLGTAYQATVTVSPSITFSGPPYVIPATITISGGSGGSGGSTVTLTLYTMGYISGYAYPQMSTTSFDPNWHSGVFFIDTEAHATELVSAAPTALIFNDSYSNSTWTMTGVSSLSYNANSYGPGVYPVSLTWAGANYTGPATSGTATLAYTSGGGGGGAPTGDITGNITSVSVLSNYGYLADFSYYGGSLTSTPSGIMNSFYWDGSGITWVKFNEGTYGSLTVSGGQIGSHMSFSLTVNGVTKTFQWASYISMYQLAEPGDVLGLQTSQGQQKAYSITLQ